MTTHLAGLHGPGTGAVRRATAKLAMALPLVTLLAACSDTDGGRPEPSPLNLSPPSVGPIPAIDSVEGLTLPSEAYYPTPEQRSVVDTAIDTLIAGCMGEFGFTWEIRQPIPEPAPQMARMYGIGDMQRAQQYGYHLLPAELGDPAALAERESAGDASRAPADPAFDLVLDGAGDADTYQGREIPEGGCAGQARGQVTEVDEIDPGNLAEEIGAAAYLASSSDSRVVEVVDAWSACMAEGGYSFATPHDAGGAWDAASGTPGADEIQTAVADMTCKQQTNLIGVWYTIQSGYEDQLIQEQILQLNEIQAAWEEAARTATEILAGAPTQ